MWLERSWRYRPDMSGDFKSYGTAGVVGLGLIGGSMAKTIKERTGICVFGYDRDEEVLGSALREGSIDEALSKDNIGKCDILLIALYPRAAVDFISGHKELISEGTMVIDLCGVKRAVIKPLMPVLSEAAFDFIGGHPMAGTEKTGYYNSRAGLFDGASMILVPVKNSEESIEKAESFFMSLGFGRTVRTDMDVHDRIIAFTSQLAHVVSNAYVKSPTAKVHDGYSAGSYLDLTRVAWLNEVMWSELFVDNREALADEIDRLIEDLRGYSELIREGRQEELQELLREGRIQKEMIDRREDLKR